MYRLLSDGSIGCDTAEEALSIHRAMAQPAGYGGQPARKVVKKAATGTRKAAKKATSRTITEGQKIVDRALKKDIKNQNGQSRSWAEAREEARKQGRPDVANVRSELAAKKKAGAT